MSASLPTLSHVTTGSDWNVSCPFCIGICSQGQRPAPVPCALHRVLSVCLTSLLVFPGCQNKSPAAKRVWQETASWAQGVSLQRSYSKSLLMGEREEGVEQHPGALKHADPLPLLQSPTDSQIRTHTHNTHTHIDIYMYTQMHVRAHTYTTFPLPASRKNSPEAQALIKLKY